MKSHPQIKQQISLSKKDRQKVKKFFGLTRRHHSIYFWDSWMVMEILSFGLTRRKTIQIFKSQNKLQNGGYKCSRHMAHLKLTTSLMLKLMDRFGKYRSRHHNVFVCNVPVNFGKTSKDIIDLPAIQASPVL